MLLVSILDEEEWMRFWWLDSYLSIKCVRHRGDSKTDPLTDFIWLSHSEQNPHRPLITVVISTIEKKIQEALLLPAGWRMLYSRWGLRMYSKGRDEDEGPCVYVCVVGREGGEEGWVRHTEQALNRKGNKSFSSKETDVLRNQAGGHWGVWVGIVLWEWIMFCFLTGCLVHMGSCFVLIPQLV